MGRDAVGGLDGEEDSTRLVGGRPAGRREPALAHLEIGECLHESGYDNLCVVGVDPYARPVGRFYAFYIERPLLARAVGRLTWGTTFRSMYRSLASVRDLAAGATVLDACCGGGLALRWLDPSTIARYVGIDTSSGMLERARDLARRRCFTNAELQLADVEAIPLPHGAADVALLYNALHAVPNPYAAAVDVARCLKSGGPLLGTMVVRGRGRRADRIIELEGAKEDGLMGPGGTASDLEEWLRAAGFRDIDISLDGTLAAFRAKRDASQRAGATSPAWTRGSTLERRHG